MSKPINLVIEFNPSAGSIRIATRPTDFMLALAMLSYATGKVQDEMLHPKEEKKIIPFTGPIPPITPKKA